MAENILRLKVQSEEYDAKLKQAAQGLTRYADECRKVGGTLEVVEKETLDYVRALGQMDTTSRTATGKLAEMKKTFTELSVVYKNMTDQEKNSPFGKALATSLDQLKVRIGESKAQLDDINKSINGGGGLTGALDSLSEKFGMSVQSLAGWGTALAAGKAALDVAKDAFFASEATVDEWGRVMDSSKSLYEGFLTALNTGDISGFLSRIDSIVQAARTAYNELDRLGTMKTIQAPQMSAQQTENERMRMMIQTGRYIAPVDGRRATMQNGQLLTPDQIKRIEQQLQNGMQKVVSLVGNEVAQTGRAIDAVYNRQAQELGMSLKEFRKGTSSMAEFDKRMAGYDQYQQWRAAHTTIDIKSGRETVARGNPYEQFAKWGTFRVDGDRYNDLVKLIQQRDQQAGQAYSMQSQAYRTMNRAEGITLKGIMGGSGSGGGSGHNGSSTSTTAVLPPEGSIAAQEALVSELTKKWKEASDEAGRAGYLGELEKAKAVLDQMQGKVKEVKVPEMATGFSGLSNASLSAWTAGLKQQLDNAEIGSTLYQSLSAQLADATAISNLIATSLKNGLDLSSIGLGPDALEGFWNSILNAENITPEELQPIVDAINEYMGENPIKLNFDTGGVESVKQVNQEAKAMGEAWKNAASAIKLVGSAISGIEDPAAKVASIIAETVATIAMAYAETLAKDKTSKSNIFGFIAASSAAMISMTTSIAAVRKATAGSYSDGGIIPGDSYSGDNQLAMVNAGELILSRSAQNNIASQLQQVGTQQQGASPYVSGEQIYLGLSNYLRRTGRGEIITAR